MQKDECHLVLIRMDRKVFDTPYPFFFLFVLMRIILINLMKGVYSMQNVEEITLDRHGRMIYHPEFHPRHEEEYTTEELEYLC
jgi:hypothetical protein